MKSKDNSYSAPQIELIRMQSAHLLVTFSAYDAEIEDYVDGGSFDPVND